MGNNSVQFNKVAWMPANYQEWLLSNPMETSVTEASIKFEWSSNQSHIDQFKNFHELILGILYNSGNPINRHKAKIVNFKYILIQIYT